MKNEEIIRGGLDIGNKNLKICAEEGQAHEIPVAYREVTEYDYKEEPVGEGTEKVFYNNEYYFVGLQCEGGLPQNKGDKKIRKVANMFKLVGLARELRRRNMKKGDFYVVTGTPVNDYDAYKNDYLDLLITKDDKYEEIEINNDKYEIKVRNAKITKQSACIAPTIPNWKEIEFLLVDFGGGTLDIAHFRQGVKQRYLTIDFPLNEILEELGNVLNAHKLGIPRPDSLDSGYIKIMEDVIMEGKYRNATYLDIEGEKVDIQQFCLEWLQSRIDNLVENIKIKFKFSETDAQSIPIFYAGGGAKLLTKVLLNNKGFSNKKIIDNPHFANVSVYYAIAKNTNWEE